MATWSDILQSMTAIDEADVVLSVSIATENFDITITKNKTSGPPVDTPPVDDIEWEVYGTEQRGTVITDSPKPEKTAREKKIDVVQEHFRSTFAPNALQHNAFITNPDSLSNELVNRTYEQVMALKKRARDAAERLRSELNGDRFGKIDGV